MARLIHSPTGDGPVNAFETLVVNTFLNSLPDAYLIIPNFSIKEPRGHLRVRRRSARPSRRLRRRGEGVVRPDFRR